MQGVVEGVYESTPDLQQATLALRSYNALVHSALCVLLGGAEQVEPLRINEVVGGLADQMMDGRRLVHLTLSHPVARFLRPTHPVWVELGTPLDGLYMVVSHTLAFEGGSESDLGLWSLPT